MKLTDILISAHLSHKPGYNYLIVYAQTIFRNHRAYLYDYYYYTNDSEMYDEIHSHYDELTKLRKKQLRSLIIKNHFIKYKF